VRSRNSGSGWAGTEHEDLGKADMQGLIKRAIDKCRKSENPLRMEPGRHTVILEPQALADMFSWAFLPFIWQRKRAEMGVGPYAASSTKSKIGMQMMDRRLSVWSDPVDPNRHSSPFDLIGGRLRHVDWWKDGVLMDLPYGRDYAVQHKLNNGEGLGGIPWIMSGGTTTLEEMIATTRTGFLVTRFHDCYPLETQSLMCTGNTRDGFWYIENGQIKHPAQNFRFNESPFFVLNQVEAIGPVSRTYQELPYSPVAPLIKVRNFNFTSLADAV
jgi:predicted Zn-dependent protease